ncbi:aldo-keto reductase AKR2E4-like [Bicyclus anynana]|uniref:Aldo-keto reductase AKR2E4-like n=1 Tax=Bicyclus anynana TaxID=110368 RepID=A0A6J1NBI6_BICAN|nr:aldo-keto reductase AKR2E4-like [Bicyclus anynana]
MRIIIVISILLEVVVLTVSTNVSVDKYKILNDGNLIPAVALGTWADVSGLPKVKQSVIYAIEVGFRHLDTAHLYGNERLIGEALSTVFKRGIVTREEMFITTKLDIAVPSRKKVVPALKENLKRLGLDNVNLFLIHGPENVFNYSNYDILDIWKGMEDCKRLGLARSIGVSNFNSSHINRILRYSKIRPAVNEIEVNPTRTNLDLVAYCQSEGIVVMGYAPFGFLVPRPNSNITGIPPTFEDPILVKMARKYGKETSQINLRYQVNRNIIPIPRSQNMTHISLNLNLFDFDLTQKEVYTINEFNRNLPVYAAPGDETIAVFRAAYETLLSLPDKYR